MILPIRLFRSKDLAAIAAHEDIVLAFAKDVAAEVVPMFGEGRRIGEASVLDRAVMGYARPLAQVLRHVDLSEKKGRPERVKRLLLTGASDLALKDSAFIPPALRLVVSSSYCIAYPGGVDLFEALPDIYVRPSLRGDAAGFSRTVDNMDMYWNDTLEGIRRADLLGELENKQNPNETDKSIADELRNDLKSKDMSHYRRLATKLNAEWRREKGVDPSKCQKWIRLARYWEEARSAVQIPEIKE